jgi:hypothetical protein
MTSTTKRHRRQRLAPAAGAELVRDWGRSGLRPAEYCRARGVTARQLSYWRKKSRPTDFVELLVGEEPGGPSDAFASIEVVVGDVVVRIPSGPGVVLEVLEALCGRSR